MDKSTRDNIENDETKRLDNETDENYLERLKIIYDLKKQKIAHKNRIYQVLLGLVAAFGALEITLCLCKSRVLWLEITFSIVSIVFTLLAVIFISKSLLYSNQKEIESGLNNAKKLKDIHDVINHYIVQIEILDSIHLKRERFFIPSIVFTVIVGVASFALEVASFALEVASFII